MPMCKFCGKPFSWGQLDGRWKPLVPVGDDDGLDRSFQDEMGNLRADHGLVCVRIGGPSVRISKLARPIKGSDVLPSPPKGAPIDEDGVIQTNYA